MKTSNGTLFSKCSLLHSVRIPAVIVSALVVCAGTQAAVITTYSSSNDTGAPLPVSATDLIDQGSTTLASQDPTAATVAPNFTASPTYGRLNDGSTGYGFQNAVSNLNVAYTATFTLDISVNTYGYDITGVNSFASPSFLGGFATKIGWQDYELLYSVVGNASFTSLGSFILDSTTFAAGNDDYFTKMAITSDSGPIASGVDAIRFIIQPTNTASEGTGMLELDVLGVASIPEPSTTAMFAFAGIGMLLLVRKRNLSASR